MEFNHRLEALGRVQGLLSRADKEPITIESLIRMELDALGASRDAPDRVVLAGPAVRIRYSMVQTLALVLHELATNARKHGALATDQGRLRISWRVRKADGQGRRLALEWVEDAAGVSIDLDPARRGYGRELIERALPYSLDADTRYELRPDGARCFIDVPLEKSERKRRTR
jgi:two-component sensor histidine kinase